MTANGSASPGTLYVVGTPIGNLADLSTRAIEVLSQVDLLAAEDTRRAGRLLSHISQQKDVIAYHEHNEERQTKELIAQLEGGASVALVSDAGMPLISDPGWRLVHAARAQSIDVVVVPGPSAALVALVASGLPTDRFVFEGFLPRRKGPRDARLARLAREGRTIVLFESVHRIAATVDALVESCGGDRPAAIARELTKVHEQVRVGSLAELRVELGAKIPLLGEFVIVVGGQAVEPDEAEAVRVYELLSAELPPDRATALVSAITGLARNRLYALTRR